MYTMYKRQICQSNFTAYMFLNYCIRKLHEFYYYSKPISKGTTWLGFRIKKYPTDCWIYQEIIFQSKPDVIIECGTKFGGSALYFATILDAVGGGRVLTIDIQKKPDLPAHPRVTYITGSSIEKSTFEKVKSLIKNIDKVMVVLDSDHHKDHVLKEMELYGSLVKKGFYLIVEDTNQTILAQVKGYGPGPDKAVKEFLKTHKEFIIDKKREKFLITTNPDGYLLRVE